MDTMTLGTIHSGERLKTSFVRIAVSCTIEIQLYCCWMGVQMCVIWNRSSQRDDCSSYPLLLLRSKFTVLSLCENGFGPLKYFPF